MCVCVCVCWGGGEFLLNTRPKSIGMNNMNNHLLQLSPVHNSLDQSATSQSITNLHVFFPLLNEFPRLTVHETIPIYSK